MCFQLFFVFFSLFLGLKAKWKWDSELNYESDKAKSHVKKCEQFVMSARCQACKNEFTFNPLFFFESTSTEGPTAFSSFPAPSQILPLDAQKLTAAPAKS